MVCILQVVVTPEVFVNNPNATMQLQTHAVFDCSDAKFRTLDRSYTFLRHQVCLVVINSSTFWSGLRLQGSVDASEAKTSY